MFSKIRTMKYTTDYLNKIMEVKNKIEVADAVVIGAGAGMSSGGGFSYSGERFYKYFSDFNIKYGISDMYSGGFYPFEVLEEYWAWWSRQIYINRYNKEIGEPYKKLLKIIKDKNFFVITTNVDHQFQKAGFDKNRLFYTQGDYGLFQCSTPCHNVCYDNKEIIERMFKEQLNMKIPGELIPYCPKCGEPMTVNLRIDGRFVQDNGWYNARKRYESFLSKYKMSNIVFMEIGVGSNTPGIIKYPFWQMTAEYENAYYICINIGNAFCPLDIKHKSLCINEDINKVLTDIN